jgi:hypothetical protein
MGNANTESYARQTIDKGIKSIDVSAGTQIPPGGILSMQPIAGSGMPSGHRGIVVPTPPIDAPQRAALRNFDPAIERGVMDVVRAKR